MGWVCLWSAVVVKCSKTSALWRRAAPRPILGAPYLPLSNEGFFLTVVANHTPVRVHRLLGGFPFCIRLFWLFTLDSCGSDHNLIMTGDTAQKECTSVTTPRTFTNRNTSIPAVARTASDASSYKRVPINETNVKSYFALSNIYNVHLYIWAVLPVVTHSCSCSSKHYASWIFKLSVQNLSWMTTTFRFGYK